MTFTFDSRRSTVHANHHMVATSQPLAVMAGLRILDAGGSAADAAVATSAALCVTEPGSNGLGGDGFALHFDAAGGEVTAFNASGRAPAALSLERVARDGFTDALPATHAHTVTVPGLVSGWFALHEAHGRLPMSRLLEPAIALAEHGFPVAPLTATWWSMSEGLLAAAPGGEALLIGGRAPRAGERFSNPALARVLRGVAERGPEAFYSGDVAHAITRAVRSAGGVMSADDLARHRAEQVAPIHADYRGARVWECPPNGQGLAALIALRVLEGFDLSALAPLSDARLHLAIESIRLGFAEARAHVADPAFAPAPLDMLLSDAHIQSLRAQIGERAMTHGAPEASSDTVYLCCVDADGDACSFIDSNYMGFGTGIVPEGCGFSLQNRGHGFSLDPEHPNHLEPGKRPYHTIIPGLLTDASTGDLIGPFGVMGGFMQPQGHLQVVSAMRDDGCDPQAALNRPRFCLQAGDPMGAVALEAGIPEATLRGLRARGHEVVMVSDHARALFGRGQIITRLPGGGWAGGSDPRADGCALGW